MYMFVCVYVDMYVFVMRVYVCIYLYMHMFIFFLLETVDKVP